MRKCQTWYWFPTLSFLEREWIMEKRLNNFNFCVLSSFVLYWLVQSWFVYSCYRMVWGILNWWNECHSKKHSPQKHKTISRFSISSNKQKKLCKKHKRKQIFQVNSFVQNVLVGFSWQWDLRINARWEGSVSLSMLSLKNILKERLYVYHYTITDSQQIFLSFPKSGVEKIGLFLHLALLSFSVSQHWHNLI